MNLTLTMVDTETGEILARNNKNLTFNFNTNSDAGFRTCLEWCMSAVRGVRTTDHKSIELRFHFCEEQGSLPLPFGMTDLEARKQAADYVR